MISISGGLKPKDLNFNINIYLLPSLLSIKDECRTDLKYRNYIHIYLKTLEFNYTMILNFIIEHYIMQASLFRKYKIPRVN